MAMILIILYYLLFLIFFLLLLRAAYVILSSYWRIPRHIKHVMEKQGVSGPKPKFLTGNLAEMATIISKSASKDTQTVGHTISSAAYSPIISSGPSSMRFIYWCNTEPRMCLAEPELVKEFLSAKNVRVSGKSWLQQQNSKHFIGRGLLMANGENWYHQRHRVAPAFTPDRIKNLVGYMIECTASMLNSLQQEEDLGF